MNFVNTPTSHGSLNVQKKSQLVLEFPKVIEILTTYTRSPISYELASDLLPKFDQDQTIYLQKETLEASKILNFAQDFSLTRDPRPFLQRALKGGVLSAEELIIIADAYMHVRKAKTIGSKLRSETPLLRELTKGISDFKTAEREIRTSISLHGELLDQASPALPQLRFESRSAYRNAEEKLEAIINSDELAPALQDNVVTFRSDRLVVPIKSDFRGQVPGIIHGVSDSGATLFIEPFSAVGATNRWKEKSAAERDEIQRILQTLTSKIARVAADCMNSLYLAGRLDLALSKARYAATYHGVGLPESSDRIELIEAKHPLLGNMAVPISLRLSGEITSLAITGPNTGGKTAAIKTLGLLILMRQSGLLVPCDKNSRLPVVDGVFADIGDQQNLEQSISTFSSHLLSIKEIISCATSSSVVLLDELGSSTDPQEGSALAIAILAHLVDEIEAFTVITTHHRSVASYANEHPKIENASVDIDPSTSEPTYKLTQGIPGRSYAIETAKRVGLPTHLINRAIAFLSPAHQETEKLLVDIQKERLITRIKLEEAEQQRIRATEIEDELNYKIEQISKSQETLILDTKKQLLEQVRAISIKLKKASAFADWLRLSGSRGSSDSASDVIDELNQTQRALKSKKWFAKQEKEFVKPVIKAGDYVEIEPFGFVGKLLEEPDEQGNSLVMLGSAKLKLHLSRLKLSQKETNLSQPSSLVKNQWIISELPIETELDIRGMDSNEALDKFLGFLSRAISDGLNEIRVIHGKGSGTLKRVIWQYLSQSELIEDYNFAPRQRGGEGATEITLPSFK